MPTYEYLCQECGERLEVFQKFTDKPLKSHAECGGALQKVFHASGVVFKGSGYYVNENRSNGSKSKTTDSDSTKAPTDSSGTEPEKKSEKKAESKPAKASESAAAAAG